MGNDENRGGVKLGGGVEMVKYLGSVGRENGGGSMLVMYVRGVTARLDKIRNEIVLEMGVFGENEG